MFGVVPRRRVVRSSRRGEARDSVWTPRVSRTTTGESHDSSRVSDQSREARPRKENASFLETRGNENVS